MTKDELAQDIREAFVLLKELRSFTHGEVNLTEAIIVTGRYTDCPTDMLGMLVYTSDLQTSFEYYIAIPDPSSLESVWLRCHREAMENRG